LNNKTSFPEIISEIREILKKVDTALNDHEQRLQLIEQVDLKIELELLHTRILSISDPKKPAALQAFKNLCDSLGFPDLESVQA